MRIFWKSARAKDGLPGVNLLKLGVVASQDSQENIRPSWSSWQSKRGYNQAYMPKSRR